MSKADIKDELVYLNGRVDSIVSENAVTGNMMGTMMSNVSGLMADVNTAKLNADAAVNQTLATDALLRELLDEIKDLREEGTQQEREIEQLRKELGEFKEEIKDILSNMDTASATCTLNSISSSCSAYIPNPTSTSCSKQSYHIYNYSSGEGHEYTVA